MGIGMILALIALMASFAQLIFLSGTPTANKAGKNIAFFTLIVSVFAFLLLVPNLYFDVPVQPDNRVMPGMYKIVFSQLPLFNFFMFQIFKRRIRREEYVY